MTHKRKHTAPPPIQAMTSLGTGRHLLPNVDGRTGPARRYRELVSNMTDDAGGDLPLTKHATVCRAAMLIVWAEQHEAGYCNGQDFDPQTYTTVCNSLRRLLQDLGLERRAKDITPSLADIMESSQ